MKNKNLIKGALTISAFTLIIGGVITAQAASNDDLFRHFRKGDSNMFELKSDAKINFNNLSEEEKELKRSEGEEKREEMKANRELIEQAITDGDYETWKSLVPEDCLLLDEINADNFSNYQEQLLNKGERQEGQNLKNRREGLDKQEGRESLNKEKGNFNNLSEEEKELKRAEGEEKREEMRANRELIEQAITDGDYETWKSLVPEDCSLLDEINADNFSEFHNIKF